MKFILAKAKDIREEDNPVYEVGIHDSLLDATNQLQKKIFKKYSKNEISEFKEHDDIIYITLGKYDYFIDIVNDDALSTYTDTI